MARLSVRQALPSDKEGLLELHERHGDQFILPDLDAPDNIVACIVEDESGRMVGAGILHVMAEGHFMLDHSYGTPADRWELAKVIIEAQGRVAWARGFRDVLVATPSKFRGFARKLATLAGFVSDDHRTHFKVLLDRRFIA